MKTYTAAVVGCGSGGGLSLAAYAASNRYELAAACDRDSYVLERVAQEYPGIRTFTDHRRMLEDAPTDVVSVSTFPPSHEPITMDVLSLPVVGILVEKPLADTAAGGRRILDAAKSRQLPLVVPHSWFARDIAQEIADRLLGGDIGRLQMMEVQCKKWDIMSAGIHWVHFFLSVIPADEVALVMASADRSTRTYRDGVQVETMSVTYVQMRSGTRMVMQTGDDTEVARGEALFRFFGEAGTLEWCLQENAYSIRNARHPTGQTVEVPIRDRRRPHHRYVDALAEQMDTGSPDYTVPNASLTALEICQAAYLSANNRCRVTFPFQAFTVPPDTGWDPGAPYQGEGGGRDGRKL